jgi:pantoate--beta-alanine ligase
MKILHSKAKITATTIAWQGAGETVCLVPTMGSIHHGHLALIAAARKTASRVIVSIYVNPAQFSAGEDFDHYPRTLNADCAAITADGGCDAIYAPATMYDDGHATSIVPAGVALAMESQTRPHFFTGVATIVLKLFNHIPANFAIFGEKDYQQLAVIRQMVHDLNLNITILTQPTIRETDGLALSSRNLYLSIANRKLAPVLYAEMQETANQITKGTPIDVALASAKTRLTKAGFGKIDYFDLRHSDNLQLAKTLAPNCRIFAAIWLGTTRLIDNYAL